MSHRTVLIAGAGIAGPTLAHWLTRYGMTPTVVERAPALRPGGQTVDLRGAGLDVIRRMGLEAAARDAATREAGIRFVDDQDRTKAALPADAFGGQGPIADLEILRPQLSALLYEHTRHDTEYLFGDEITALGDDGNEVHVTLKNGGERSFDLVVAADGIRSRTRDLVFTGTRTKGFGLCTAYFTIPHRPSDGRWARWHNAPGHRSITLRPDNLGTTRAALSFLTPARGYERLEPARQKRLLHDVFGGLAWEVPRILSEMDNSADFFFESVGQVHMPRWSRERTAATGDAAYCASPLSGMGTSLALTGAYVLAGELARHTDHRAAFTAYENILRPYTARAQKLPPGTPRAAMPRTRTGIATLNTVLRTATRKPVSTLLSRFLVPPADTFALPAYDSPV
ncbi:FAD-dependent monooxygenase [Streptomyces sp. NPDC001744]|uniref:FAD-dependent monooxygenase n=1 Tax=Streptomyces sp. NPDC001744 TaxID=3364606 RepID=UPI0036CA1996